MTRPWQDILTGRDRQIIDAAGYARRGAATTSSRGEITKPALLIVDMQQLFTGDDVPIQDAIQVQPTMIGADAWDAARQIVTLRAACRVAKVPVIYLQMIPNGRTVNDPLLSIMDLLSPADGEPVIVKHSASGFFNTGLADMLAEHSVDGVIVTGNSTSGCVRATVVDAVQHGLQAIVPEECVCDRIVLSHKVALLDMWMKYARVLPVDDVVEWIMDFEHTSS